MIIPPPVDRMEDIPEAELPPRKRLCLTAITSRYEVGESSTTAPRPTGGHMIDYGFIGTLDAETRHQIMKQDNAKQAARNEKLVSSDDKVKISKSNLRMDPSVTQREETYQVVLDIIKNTPFYNAFLISADVLEIYMQQFWLTITKMHQRWRTFGAIINRCLSGKMLSNDRLRPSRIRILLGSYHKANVDYAALIWEDLQYQIDNQIETERVIKASRCESRFQHQTGGLSEGAGLRPEVPDELTGKFADSDEGAGTSLEVLDESEDKSKPRDELDDWGSILAYKDEKPKDIPWKSTDEDESDNDDKDESNDESDDEEEDDKKQKADGEHEADEEQKGDEHVGDEQVVVPVSTTQLERPSLLQSASSHFVSSNFVPNTEAVKSVVERFTELERAVKELNQADHSTAILASIRSQVPSVVKEYLGSSLPDAFQKVLQSHTEELKNELFEKRDYKDIIEESVQANVINEVKNFLPKFLPQAVKEALEKTPPSLGQSSSQGQSAIKAVESLSNWIKPGMKTKNRRVNESKSSKKTSTTTESSKGKSLAKTSKFGKSVTAEEPVEEPVFEIASDDVEQTVDDEDWYKDSLNPEVLDLDWNTVKTIDDTPEQPWFNEMIQAEKPPLTFDNLMSTPIDFSAYAMNHLKLYKITREVLVGLMFNLHKGTCKICVELEYNMEECYRALTDPLN
ncbi:hypothetical protein Tco_0613919 [Tanacetum coccineum]